MLEDFSNLEHDNVFSQGRFSDGVEPGEAGVTDLQPLPLGLQLGEALVPAYHRIAVYPLKIVRLNKIKKY